jgi:hypothetical protein
MLHKAEIKQFHLYTPKNECLSHIFCITCSWEVAVVLDKLVEEKNPPDYLVQLICTPYSYAIKFMSDG